MLQLIHIVVPVFCLSLGTVLSKSIYPIFLIVRDYVRGLVY